MKEGGTMTTSEAGPAERMARSARIYELVGKETGQDPWFRDNFANAGQRFVAWYLRRVLLLDVHETRAAITDGQNDKQIDAIVVEDVDRRIRIIQGKFVTPTTIDAAPLREVLGSWTRLNDLSG